MLQEVNEYMSMAARDGDTEAAQNIGASHGMPFGGLGALLFGGGNEMRQRAAERGFYAQVKQNLLQDCMQRISDILGSSAGCTKASPGRLQ